ncbi:MULTISPECIES: AbfB domain-containing protein [Streptomyces]|uniref:AbfB domain-containing protein n=1 Tax=Streptomyces caniscabiei TaxID=2746961 RepID=A0ABU4MFB0_9ACTN|nr:MULTISPECIES: AbfB domain-containing protein [Streptomyces]MDX2940377.1 AbfB domain-containing protein [Streptomyces caniscabiei]MDX2950118.1 AbfB domain-containing protein [Streptomyces caniscabiei]MDX2985300.1 AbfB domain-containing protein [Streptomyces caniscabiei]MDX3007279.1 AbfB domain-containing protein [Streptomyces caniscabiei]MDX3035906.1 AbfB domain-containing protein [Streptomyces caniscabiei]
MPPHKPGPDPDQTTPNLPVLRSAKVWETGVAPNDTRIPGTRRLWLAGALALAVVSSCVTAITLQGSGPDDSSRNGHTTAAGDDRVLPSLSLPPTSPPATSAPDGKSGLSEPQGAEGDVEETDGKGKTEDADDAKGSGSSDDKQQGGAKPTAEPSKAPAPTKKPPSTSTTRKSVRSVNYPDRYWHLRDGGIQLDQVSSRSGSETREDSSFKVVSGLANSSCYSFRMADGRYVRHQNFVLRASGNDGSRLFQQDATFCPRSGYSGSVMLESVNYPGYFVRHRSFQLRLERAEHSGYFYADATFNLVKGFS